MRPLSIEQILCARFTKDVHCKATNLCLPPAQTLLTVVVQEILLICIIELDLKLQDV